MTTEEGERCCERIPVYTHKIRQNIGRRIITARRPDGKLDEGFGLNVLVRIVGS